MPNIRRRIELLQLPIPPTGLEPARGNVPLAAGYLKLMARRRGLEDSYDIDLFSPALADTLSDTGLVAALLARDPWMVGFTCYMWNVERALWIAARLKEDRPDLQVVLGGPEITPDNAWVLEAPPVDFAVLGEGEQTFADLLQALRHAGRPRAPIPGLLVRDPSGPGTSPARRLPLPRLDEISSPYRAGILDAGGEMMCLETARGCIFRCKFCYYPKSYDQVYFLSEEAIAAELRLASERGAREVVLLDPTLDQRRDFAGFLRLLARCNPGRRFTYSGELRAEGIDAETAALLRDANFTDVEVGLQSIDPAAQRLMDRKNNRRAFERGVRAMLQAGIQVTVDLIVGLPGDTPESVRRSLRYLHDGGAYSDVQVFDLAILPGTAFREEAGVLGLEYQRRPPYHVVRTPALRLEDLYMLMAEAEDLFEIEFEPLPPPRLPDSPGGPAEMIGIWKVDLDLPPRAREGRPPASRRTQVFTLWLCALDLERHRDEAVGAIRELLADNPHTTLQVVLEPAISRREDSAGSATALHGNVSTPSPAFLESLRAACYERTSYLDRFYAFLPGPMKGSKRLVLLLPSAERARLGAEWIETMVEYASILWRGGPLPSADLQGHEFVADS